MLTGEAAVIERREAADVTVRNESRAVDAVLVMHLGHDCGDLLAVRLVDDDDASDCRYLFHDLVVLFSD